MYACSQEMEQLQQAEALLKSIGYKGSLFTSDTALQPLPESMTDEELLAALTQQLGVDGGAKGGDDDEEPAGSGQPGAGDGAPKSKQ